MKTDTNPDIIFGLYASPDKKELLFKKLKENKISVRELSLISVEIPLDRKDEILNFFKHFVMCDYWAGRNPLNKDSFISKAISKGLAENIGYKPIKLKQGQWKHDNKNDLLFTLAVPLLYQDQTSYCTTEREKEVMRDLAEFKTEGYKENIQGVINPDDMEILS